MNDPERSGTLSIGDVAEQTGLSEATLRMWESRHGFPQPQRLASGHRRYGERDVELLRQVLEDRARGLSLKAAIERVAHAREEPERSLFAALRRRRPELTLHVLPKRSLTSISHAMEDELVVRAERGVLFGSFQLERHYRHAEARWRELSRTSDYVVAMADFDESRSPRGGPVELALESYDPLLREWSLVCSSPGYGAALTAVERPGQRERRDPERDFETLWSVDPEIVREAAEVCCELIAGAAPQLSRQIAHHLEYSQGSADDRFDVAAAVTSRIVAYMGSTSASRARQGRRN